LRFAHKMIHPRHFAFLRTIFVLAPKDKHVHATLEYLKLEAWHQTRYDIQNKAGLFLYNGTQLRSYLMQESGESGS
jgi:hypothetical protein